MNDEATKNAAKGETGSAASVPPTVLLKYGGGLSVVLGLLYAQDQQVEKLNTTFRESTKTTNDKLEVISNKIGDLRLMAAKGDGHDQVQDDRIGRLEERIRSLEATRRE